MDETTRPPAGPTDQPDHTHENNGETGDQTGDQTGDAVTEQADGAGRHRAEAETETDPEPDLDLEVERDIPHAEDLQDPAGDVRDAPTTTWTASPGLHIN